MASVTYDGQSFLVDGRRLWIVSGSICTARIPRAEWAERIASAKLAGLNTIDVPIVWARHEPRHGQFDFTGDNDIRAFVNMVHDAGLHCILRPGPYLGMGFDLGGIPAWVLGLNNVQLRTASPAFLEASSRYITAVAEQVRDLQVTSPGEGGPILLIQNENAWTCGHDDLAKAYLGELNRYLRESGLTVPIINANDLWQGVEGEIDCWRGEDELLSVLRQLGSVRPDQPRMVIDFEVGSQAIWGRKAPEARRGSRVLRRLTEVLAAGGQYNLSPFAGGTYFGFSSGREVDGFVCASADAGAPVDEAGRPGPVYQAVRRVSTFASRFSRVLSNLESRRVPIVAHPDGSREGGATPTPSVIHSFGTQGSVVFLFAPEDDGAASGSSAGKGKGDRAPASTLRVPLLLPDGTTITVDMGDQSATWCLFDARLTGRTTWDYGNVTPVSLVGKVVVAAGTPGSRAVLSINGSRLEAVVPKGGNGSHASGGGASSASAGVGFGTGPLIVEHEGMTVVLASWSQLESIVSTDDSVLIGVQGVTADGHTVPVDGIASVTRLGSTGERTTLVPGDPARAPEREAPAALALKAGKGKKASTSVPKAGVVKPPALAPDKLTLAPWTSAPQGDYLDGSNPRFASITGPADLDSLGAPSGYGWYRIGLKSAPSGKHRVLFPLAGDRLHVAIDGKAVGVAGVGPGASLDLSASLHGKKGGTLVVLAENAGRFASGLAMGMKCGVWGHGWTVNPIKPAAPKIVSGETVEALTVKSPQWLVHRGEVSDRSRLTWTIPHRSKTPLFVRATRLPGRGIAFLNNKPVAAFDETGLMLTLEGEQLTRGNNTFQVAMLGAPTPDGTGPTESASDELARALHFWEGEDAFTQPASWAFAKWEAPGAEAFSKASTAGKRTGVPTWWRSSFFVGQQKSSLMLDLSGLTKGQVYINGRHLGRYWVATGEGEAVEPQAEYLVPRSWLGVNQACEILLFDEHGASPAKVKLRPR